MSQFVGNDTSIMGQGVAQDMSTGNTALQAFGPSGTISIEDQNDYVFSYFNPNTGNVFHHSGDSLSGYMSIESVSGELYFGDRQFKNFPLTQPNERNLISFFINRSIVGCLNELYNKSAISASPGFTWGRSGVSNSGAWLLNDTVPSSVVGRNFSLLNGTLLQLSVSNDGTNTFTLGFYEHDHTTYTLLATIALTAQIRKTQNYTSVNVTQGKELAVKVESGSGKDIVVQAILSGTVT